MSGSARFSSNLLDTPEEYIFACFQTSFVSLSTSTFKQDGVVYIAEKSIIFAPNDARAPILKLPLAKISSLQSAANRKQLRVNKGSRQLSTITIGTNTVYNIKRYNTSHAYEMDGQYSNGECAYFFYPKSIKKQFSSLLQQLVDLAVSGGSCRALINEFEAKRIAAFLNQSQDGQAPDVVRDIVVAFYSKAQFLLPGDDSVRVKVLTTLIENNRYQRGHLVITSKNLHFASYTDPLLTKNTIPLRSISLAEAASFGESDSYICITLHAGRSFLFRFASKEQRDQIIALLPKSTQTQVSLQQATENWRLGLMSSFDYILLVNSKAGRTSHLFDCYPVFPWILKNLAGQSTIDLSDDSIYNTFTEVSASMSSAKQVANVLLRADPDFVLALNQGQFPAPQALFSDINSSFGKFELTPEFYTGDGSFLLNLKGINVSGVVSDVKLPAWARNPRQFVSIMRQALEHQHAGEYLSAWFDRIFGVQQHNGSAVSKLFDAPHVQRRSPAAALHEKVAQREAEILQLKQQIVDLENAPKTTAETDNLQAEIEELKAAAKAAEQRAVDAEKREASLKKKVSDYMNQPIFRTVDNVNNYINQLKKELEQVRHEESLRKREFEKEHEERLKIQRKFEEQKERADQAYSKYIASNKRTDEIRAEVMKKMRSSDEQQKNQVSGLRDELLAAKAQTIRLQKTLAKICKQHEISEEQVKVLEEETTSSAPSSPQKEKVTSEPALASEPVEV